MQGVAHQHQAAMLVGCLEVLTESVAAEAAGQSSIWMLDL